MTDAVDTPAAPVLTSRRAILDLADLPTETVLVPEWGGAVRVRGLTGKERDDYEGGIMVSRRNPKTGDLTQEMNLANVRARLVVRSVVDEAGQRVFTDEDAEALGGKSAHAVSRIFDVAQRLSGMRPEDLKELVGKSEATPAAGSPTASPATSD
jgi:hypothetical protein